MAFTKHNNLETIDTGTQNWDSTVNDNFEHLENGLTIKAIAGLTIAKSQMTYIDSNGQFQLAIADGTVANRYIGPATTVINKNVDGYAQNSGHYLDANWSFTVGNPVYLSAVTPGVLTQTEPAESIIVGVAIATNEITVRPWLAPKDQDLEVVDGGTGRNTATPYAVLCGGTNATAEHQSIAGLGSSGQVLKSNGADALPSFQAFSGAGTLIQTVIAMTGEMATGTGVIPNDDSIPQNNEGDEYISVAITPTDINNTLIINAKIEGTTTETSSYWPLALFQDSVADALASGRAARVGAGQQWGVGTVIYSMPAGTTSETTFKVRAGQLAAGTFTLNGTGGARKHGGTIMSGIWVQEVE